MGKTYLLKYLKPNTHTFYDIIKSDEELEIEAEIAKEPDKEKKKKLHDSVNWKRLIDMKDNIEISGGINELSEKHYLLLKEHKTFPAKGPAISTLDYMLDARPPLAQWVPGFGPEDEKLKAFSALKDREALTIVEAMWSKSLIEKYLADEKREVIKKALEAQLEKLKIKPTQKAA